MQYKCKSQEGSRQVLCVHRFSYMYSLVHFSYRKQYSIIEQCFQTAMMLIFFLFINSTPDSKHFCYFFDEISTWREMMNDTQRSAPSSVFGKGMCVFSVVYVKRYKLYPQILSLEGQTMKMDFLKRHLLFMLQFISLPYEQCFL